MSCTVVKYNVDTPILEAKIHRYIKRILFQLVVAHFYPKAIAITRFDSHVIFSNIFESREKISVKKPFIIQIVRLRLLFKIFLLRLVPKNIATLLYSFRTEVKLHF